MFKISLFLTTLLVTSLYWNQTAIVMPVLTFLIIIYFLKTQDKKTSLIQFIMIGTLGPLTEMLLISQNAWQYTEPQLFTIPIWLPLVWGMAGLLIKDLYRKLNNLFQHHSTISRS